MKLFPLLAAGALMAAAPAFAGDIEAGEKDFKKCKACHMVVSADGEEIYKGGKTGPNLYGVIGRVAGSYDGYKYGKGLFSHETFPSPRCGRPDGRRSCLRW